MDKPTRSVTLAPAVALATAFAFYMVGFTPWAQPSEPEALATFLATVILVSLCVAVDRPRSVRRGSEMRLSFLGELTALLCFGPVAMILVAAIASVARVISSRHAVSRPYPQRLRIAALDPVATIGAASMAGWAHLVLGGTTIPLAWPRQAMSISAAIIVYCIVTCGVAELWATLGIAGSPRRPWRIAVFTACQSHFIGAAVSVAVAEAVTHETWGLLAVFALPLYFAWRLYASHVAESDNVSSRGASLESSDVGVCVLDQHGRVTLWNGALARLLACPRTRAIGRSIAEAVPALSRSELPAAVREAVVSRALRMLPHVACEVQARTRVSTVTIVPDADDVLLLWRDVTEQVNAEHASRETADRFKLIVEGTNDGAWELDRRTDTLYISARWRAIVGLAPISGTLRPEAWFSRVHVEDIAALQQALETHATGGTDHLAHEHRIRHEDGTYRRVLCRGVAERDSRGRTTRIAGSLTDITETATVRERVLSAGQSDALTGLSNRAAFVKALGRRLNDYKQRLGSRFAVLYLDLDRFKIVNDSLGHLVGDELLVAVSRRLESCLRQGDVIARLGGDEFAILLHALDDAMQANVVAFRIQEALGVPFSIGGREVVISASIGIAVSRFEYTNPEEIMRDADTAMYEAKTHGKARHELFDAEMHARAIDRLGLESDLRDAVKSSGFEMYYQPIVSLSTRMCVGFEALVRWQRNGKAVSPADFIPVAEELGLIEPLGTWVLQQACRTFAEWQERFTALDCITVNVSTRQLMQQGFRYLVEQTVRHTGLKPSDLRLEITETALMDAPQVAAQVLRELREFGVKIYLDDFGTGYSSLSHLHKLPVDALKIDRSFVRGLLLDERPAIVESILALARTLQTAVVAEGVEDESQARELERLGCVQAQGFFFSRPLPASEAEQLLATGRPLGSVSGVEAFRAVSR